MLAQLTTLKARLGLDPIDVTYDALLVRAIAAVSARFDQETNRTLARTIDFCQEFDSHSTEVLAACYPIESITKFETKTSEAQAWLEQPTPNFLIHRACVISLESSFSLQPSASSLCRVTYTGGYVMPGDPDPQPSSPNHAPARLPADLEQAAVEQTAFWFQTRDKLGVIRDWPSGGNYKQFADTDLLPSVRAVLQRHTRFAL